MQSQWRISRFSEKVTGFREADGPGRGRGQTCAIGQARPFITAEESEEIRGNFPEKREKFRELSLLLLKQCIRETSQGLKRGWERKGMMWLSASRLRSRDRLRPCLTYDRSDLVTVTRKSICIFLENSDILSPSLYLNINTYIYI